MLPLQHGPLKNSGIWSLKESGEKTGTPSRHAQREGEGGRLNLVFRSCFAGGVRARYVACSIVLYFVYVFERDRGFLAGKKNPALLQSWHIYIYLQPIVKALAIACKHSNPEVINDQSIKRGDFSELDYLNFEQHPAHFPINAKHAICAPLSTKEPKYIWHDTIQPNLICIAWESNLEVLQMERESGRFLQNSHV